MTPEVIVHHPIPRDLDAMLRSLGYSATEPAGAHTRYVCNLETVSVSASVSSKEPSGGRT